jgi:hypothetical protein
MISMQLGMTVAIGGMKVGGIHNRPSQWASVSVILIAMTGLIAAID